MPGRIEGTPNLVGEAVGFMNVYVVIISVLVLLALALALCMARYSKKDSVEGHRVLGPL